MLSKKNILLLSFFLLLWNSGYSQVWPFTPMIRFGNAVYIDTNEESLSKLDRQAIFFEEGLQHRYFDVLTTQDSLQLEINGKPVYFSQTTRKEPRNKKNILFYSRRELESAEYKVTYLELKDISENKIIAEASLKKKGANTKAEKKQVVINIEELDGVFIGSGSGLRTAAIIAGVLGAAGTLLFLL